ncbi:F-box DNA helicase 1-like isoform X3 [Apostichopus japonicus]|uniref:F-box DNA helicase 1-like isoform X3 n=1 Tax=Stichopus japonicus TaxID=307972 RepID=UPI003AB4639F
MTEDNSRKDQFKRDIDSSDPSSKRRKIWMGPRECLHYSNTPEGAASLTNPQLFQRSTTREKNVNISSAQRGRSQGSCFLPEARPELKHGGPSTVTKSVSNPKRQYISPSKGTKAQPIQASVYNASGFAQIGSPKRKSMEFPTSKMKHFQSSSQMLSNRPTTTNNFKKRTDETKPSPVKRSDGKSSSSSKVSNLQMASNCPPTTGDSLQRNVKPMVNTSKRSPWRGVHTHSKSRSEYEPHTGQRYSTPNKISQGTSTVIPNQSPEKLTVFQRSQGVSPNKGNLSNTQDLSSHETPKKAVASRSICTLGSPQKASETSKLSQFQKYVPPSSSPSKSTPQFQKYAPPSSSPSRTPSPPKSKLPKFQKYVPQSSSPSKTPSPSNSKLPKFQKYVPPSSSPSKTPSPSNSKLPKFQKYVPPSSPPSKTPSPLKQTSLTKYFVKSPPKDVGNSGGCQPEEDSQRKSVKKNLNETWNLNLKNPKSVTDQRRTDFSHRPGTSLTPAGESITGSSTDSGDKQEVICKSKDDLTSSLEAFENDSIEDIFDEYDISDDGTLISSQPSQEKTKELEDAFDNDSLDEWMEDYDIDEDGKLTASQSSGRRKAYLPEEPGEDDDDSKLSSCSEESLSLLDCLGEGDDDTYQFGADRKLINQPVVKKGNGKCKKICPSSSELSGNTSMVTSWCETNRDGNMAGNQKSSNDDEYFDDVLDGDEIPDEILYEVEELGPDAATPLKARTFGLVSDGQDDEEEEDDDNRDYFANLPLEILENIFCRISVLDLLQSCSLVCHRWWNVIANDSFITWKKAYRRCKGNARAWSSPLKDSSEESGLLDVIRYLSTINRLPGESTIADLEKHSNYSFAKDLIAENLPDLMKDEHPHPWSVVAALVILAEMVKDVREILDCLLHPGSTNSTMTVTEVLYCITTLLLSLQRQHNLCRRLHFRVFYALFLFENDVRPSSVQVIDSTPDVQWKKALAGKSKFPLTQEQLRIVNHRIGINRRDEVVKVIAFAGTGKTTTLIKFAEANRYLHLLYVAFNKTVQVEASRTFPGNTECRTTHSLAFEKVKNRYGHKLTFDLKPYTIKDLLPERPKGERSKLQWALYARLVGNTIKSYVSSADNIITTRHVPETYTTAGSPRAVLTHHDRMAILKDAEYLWGRMIDEDDREAQITHDGYLKVYQLSKPIISDVQCLLIDEAQDLTPAQQDVLLNQPIPKILVGDPHQQIYSFRGARNAMDNIQADTVYHLTQSFRFGSEIAYMANCILDVFKHMTEQTIVGTEEDGSLCGQQVGQKAIVCRGNTTIFKEAVRLTTMENHSHRRLAFTGGFNFDKLMDLYKLSTGSTCSIRNDFYRKMQSFSNLEVYARNADDVELQGLIQIVRVFNHRLPELIEKIKKETVENLQSATIVLTTAHKAKGLEFDTVQLATDFSIFSLNVVPVEGGDVITEDINLPEDEKNLIYVAVTRAKKSLMLNENLKKCLGKISEHFKFPLSTKLFLDSESNGQCLDCGQAIASQQRVAMAKVWSVKIGKVGSSLFHQHPTSDGGFICSSCAHHHLPGFQKIFLGDKQAPRVAQIEELF